MTERWTIIDVDALAVYANQRTKPYISRYPLSLSIRGSTLLNQLIQIVREEFDNELSYDLIMPGTGQTIQTSLERP
jgi:hypothetical protein